MFDWLAQPYCTEVTAIVLNGHHVSFGIALLVVGIGIGLIFGERK